MKIFNRSAALLAAGLLIAIPAFAQTSSDQKQKTQDGGQTLSPSTFPGTPATKQRTQDGGQTLSPTTFPGTVASKQRTQDGGQTLSPATFPDPSYKQR